MPLAHRVKRGDQIHGRRDPGADCSTCNVDVSATIRDIAEDRTPTCTNGHSVALHDKTGRARVARDSYDRLMQRFHNIGR